MPPEWAPHAATWTAWPYDDEKWQGYLEPVRQELAGFVNTLARFEPVELVVHDEESERDARARLNGNVRFHRIPHDDLWLRDSGAMFVARPSGEGGLSWPPLAGSSTAGGESTLPSWTTRCPCGWPTFWGFGSSTRAS